MADTYWSNVSLLTHCDGTNGSVPVDQKGKTITAVGGAGISTAQFKFGTGCLELNGTNQGVTVANSADFSFGSGNFTVEMFAKFDEIAATKFLFFYGAPQSWWLYRVAQTLQFAYSTDGANSIAMPFTASVLSTSAWHHIAVVRNGTTLKLYVDGTERSTLSVGSDTFYNTAGRLSIGTYNNSYFTDGRFDEIRITKGVARYTSTPFTVPTEAFPQDYELVSADATIDISLEVEGVAAHGVSSSCDTSIVVEVEGVAAIAQPISTSGDFSIDVTVEGVAAHGVVSSGDADITVEVDGVAVIVEPINASGDFSIAMAVEGGALHGQPSLLDIRLAVEGTANHGVSGYGDAQIPFVFDSQIGVGRIGYSEIVILLKVEGLAGRGTVSYVDETLGLVFAGEANHKHLISAVGAFDIPLSMTAYATHPADEYSLGEEQLFVVTKSASTFVNGEA